MNKPFSVSIKIGVGLALVMLPVSVDTGEAGVTIVPSACAAAAGERCDLLLDYICSGPPPLQDYYDAVCVSGCGPG